MRRLRRAWKVLLLSFQPIPWLNGKVQAVILIMTILGLPTLSAMSRVQQLIPVESSAVVSLAIFSVLLFICAYRLQTEQESRPNIVVAGASGIYTDDRQFNIAGLRPLFVARCVHVRFANEPRTPGIPGKTAKDVGARITYKCSDGRSFPIDGRWADATQPAALHPLQSRNELLRADFPPGATHEVDIALREKEDRDWYAINNDSFTSATLKNEHWKLTGEFIDVEVRLQSEEIDQSFSFRLRNRGQGFDLELVS